jgi:hypothetical protein
MLVLFIVINVEAESSKGEIFKGNKYFTIGKGKECSSEKILDRNLKNFFTENLIIKKSKYNLELSIEKEK